MPGRRNRGGSASIARPPPLIPPLKGEGDEGIANTGASFVAPPLEGRVATAGWGSRGDQRNLQRQRAVVLDLFHHRTGAGLLDSRQGQRHFAGEAPRRSILSSSAISAPCSQFCRKTCGTVGRGAMTDRYSSVGMCRYIDCSPMRPGPVKRLTMRLPAAPKKPLESLSITVSMRTPGSL